MSLLTHLIKDQRGLWQATLADGSVHDSVTVVRAFPIRAPDEAISVIDHEGHELCWIEHVSALNDKVREAVVSALQARECQQPDLDRGGCPRCSVFDTRFTIAECFKSKAA